MHCVPIKCNKFVNPLKLILIAVNIQGYYSDKLWRSYSKPALINFAATMYFITMSVIVHRNW